MEKPSFACLPFSSLPSFTQSTYQTAFHSEQFQVDRSYQATAIIRAYQASNTKLFIVSFYSKAVRFLETCRDGKSKSVMALELNLFQELLLIPSGYRRRFYSGQKEEHCVRCSKRVQWKLEESGWGSRTVTNVEVTETNPPLINVGFQFDPFLQLPLELRRKVYSHHFGRNGWSKGTKEVRRTRTGL